MHMCVCVCLGMCVYVCGHMCMHSTCRRWGCVCVWVGSVPEGFLNGLRGEGWGLSFSLISPGMFGIHGPLKNRLQASVSGPECPAGGVLDEERLFGDISSGEEADPLAIVAASIDNPSAEPPEPPNDDELVGLFETAIAEYDASQAEEQQAPTPSARRPRILADLVYVLPSGKGQIKWYPATQHLCAECKNPLHRRCFTKRTVRPSDTVPGQGRPFGLLLAWLEHCPPDIDRHDHVWEFLPTPKQRKDCRTAHTCAASEEIRRKERPRRLSPPEPEEPLIIT